VNIFIQNLDLQSNSLTSGYTYTSIPQLSFVTGTSSPTPPNPDAYGTTTTNITHTFTVKNIGEGTTSSISVNLIGTDAAAWILGTDNCTGQTLAVNATCTIQATFLGSFLTPKAYSATLQVGATSGGTVTNSISGIRP
jgi:hypothetical protein